MLIGCAFTNNNAGRTGLSPTINIYDLSDDSLTVSAASMNEVAEGGYNYNFSEYDSSKNYYWVADAGAAVPTRERYRRGWTGMAGAIPDAQAGVSGGLATVDSNNYIAGIQGTKNILDDMTDITAAQVNAEIVDVLTIDTHSQPTQGAPPATTSILKMLQYMYKRWRNKYTEVKEDSSTTSANVYNDTGDTIDHTCNISDDGTTFTKTEYTGP